MNRILLSSRRWRLPLQGAAGLCITYSLHHRQAGSFLLDSHAKGYTPNAARDIADQTGHGLLNPEVLKDISQGSLSGVGLGLLIGVFSKALVLVSGLTMFTFHILQRWGLNVPELLGLREKVKKAVFTQPLHNAVFRLAFAITFTLAAFVRF